LTGYRALAIFRCLGRSFATGSIPAKPNGSSEKIRT
jgi:hypothetical protein